MTTTAPAGDALRRWFAESTGMVQITADGWARYIDGRIVPGSICDLRSYLTGWPGFGRGVEYARSQGWNITLQNRPRGWVVFVTRFGHICSSTGETVATDPAEAMYAAIWQAKGGE